MASNDATTGMTRTPSATTSGAITPAEGVAPAERAFIEINAAGADGVDAVNRLVAEYRANAN
jgi:hypothetical protein